MEVYDQEVSGFLAETFVFNAQETERLLEILTLFEILEYERNEFVLTQGDFDEHLYFVYQGRLRQTFHTRHDTHSVGLAQRGDVLNLEMLSPGTPAITSFRTVVTSVLLRINRANLRKVVDAFPEAYENLALLFDSFKQVQKQPLEFKENDEIVYYCGRRHPVFLYARVVLPLLLFVLVMVIYQLFAKEVYSLTPKIVTGGLIMLAGAWALWSWLDWRNDFSIISNLRVLFMEKVISFYSSRQEAPLKSILSVTTESSQMGRMFSYGDVIIRTYTGAIRLPGLENYLVVARLIESLWQRAQEARMSDDRHEVEVSLRQQLGMDVPPDAEGEELPSTAAPVNVSMDEQGLLPKLAYFFSLRSTEGDTIKYWTHWIYLFKALLVPALVLACMVGLVIFQPSLMFNANNNFSPNLVISGLLVFSILWFIYKFVDWRNDVYIITLDQVMDINKKPLGHEQKQTAQIKNILSIEFKRLGLASILLNYGTVFIKVGESTLTFDNVFNPAAVQKELFNRMTVLQQKQDLAKQEAERRRMAEMIGTYHQLLAEKEGRQR